MNKIDIINLGISLINCIRTPTNSSSKKILAIVDLGANMHLEKNPPQQLPQS